MSPFRRHKSPLFDLIRGGTSSPDNAAAAPPVATRSPVSVDPTPLPSRPRPTLSSHTPGDESTADRITSLRNGPAPRPNGGLVSLPLNGIYLSIAAVIGVAILVWALAYWLGGRAKEKELAPYISAGVQPTGPQQPNGGTPANPTTNPGSNPAPVPPPRLSGYPVGTDSGKSNPTTQPPTLAAPSFTGAGNVLTSKGMAEKDPREPGLNYLAIVRLPRSDAEKVVTFLAANGLEAIGVPAPVEKGSKAANNLPLYQIIALQGITGEQYRKEDPIKVKVDQEVQRLGVIWKRDHRGTTNFMQSGWVKYKGDGQ